jgi:hypothetical protein
MQSDYCQVPANCSEPLLPRATVPMAGEPAVPPAAEPRHQAETWVPFPVSRIVTAAPPSVVVSIPGTPTPPICSVQPLAVVLELALLVRVRWQVAWLTFVASFAVQETTWAIT